MVNSTRTDEIVDGVLRELLAGLRARDRDALVDLFMDDGVLFGSEEGESAIGRDALRSFFDRVCAAGATFGWVWSEIIAREVGGSIWFVAPATTQIERDGEILRESPYRISGVLVGGASGRWRFVLYNGSEPASPEDW